MACATPASWVTGRVCDASTGAATSTTTRGRWWLGARRSRDIVDCEAPNEKQFPLPFMVVGLRDEAQNRKCPVSRTLVTPHVPAHDRAFRGLGSSASTERILTLSFTCASPCCPLAGTQRINPESPSCLILLLLDHLGSFEASSHHNSPVYACQCSFLSRRLESLGWFTLT